MYVLYELTPAPGVMLISDARGDCMYVCLSVCMHVVVCAVCIHDEHHAPAQAMSGIYFAPGWPPKVLTCLAWCRRPGQRGRLMAAW